MIPAVVVSVFLDAVVIIASFLGAYWLRFNLPLLPSRPVPAFDLYLRFSLLVGLVGIVSLHASGVYRDRRIFLDLEKILLLVRGTLLFTIVIMIISFVFRGYISRSEFETYSRLIIGMTWFISFLALSGWRLGWIKVMQYFHRNGWGYTRLLILGINPTSLRFYQAVKHEKNLGYQAIGFLYEEGTCGREGELPVLGGIERLPDILRHEKIHEVITVLDRPAPEVISRLINDCQRADVSFRQISDVATLLMAPVEFREIVGFPVFSPKEQLLNVWNRYTKRMIDVVGALFLLTFLSPWGLILAMMIKLGSRGPVFFTQQRVGKNERFFKMYKFRSMCIDAEGKWDALKQRRGNQEDPLLRLKQDPRVTRVGHLMRRFSLDELPQLINVLKGEMSLVGPRPHIPAEVAWYQEWQKKKFDVLPGMTGLTQVSGRRDLTLEDMIKLDIYYIDNWSVWLDIKIILQTLPIVLNGRGAY